MTLHRLNRRCVATATDFRLASHQWCDGSQQATSAVTGQLNDAGEDITIEREVGRNGEAKVIVNQPDNCVTEVLLRYALLKQLVSGSARRQAGGCWSSRALLFAADLCLSLSVAACVHVSGGDWTVP